MICGDLENLPLPILYNRTMRDARGERSKAGINAAKERTNIARFGGGEEGKLSY